MTDKINLFNGGIQPGIIVSEHMDESKFILLLRKGVYPYEYVDSWERFDETSLLDKEAFYSSLNMEDIMDDDHRHAKIKSIQKL